MRFRTVLMLALIIAAVATVSYGLPESWSDTYYYTDATHTQEVGEYYVGCYGGQNYHYGVRTSYYETTGGSCDDVDYWCISCYVDPNFVFHCDTLCLDH